MVYREFSTQHFWYFVGQVCFVDFNCVQGKVCTLTLNLPSDKDRLVTTMSTCLTDKIILNFKYIFSMSNDDVHILSQVAKPSSKIYQLKDKMNVHGRYGFGCFATTLNIVVLQQFSPSIECTNSPVSNVFKACT